MSEIKTAEEIIGLINDYWKFDNQQQPMSSWNDKQDLINLLSSQFKEVKPKYGVSDDIIHDELENYYLQAKSFVLFKYFKEYAEPRILKLLSLSTPSKESDAVEFAEWLRRECNCFDSSPNWYYLNDGENSPKTSAELYDLFKQSKTK